LIQEKDQTLAGFLKQEPTVEDPLDIPVLEGEEMWAQAAIDNFAITEADADNVVKTTVATHAGFGTKFPTDPQKGDMFLRVDMLPNRLFKWNGQKWIEVEKTITDRYAYEEEYINYITDKVKTGEYDFHDLTKPEQEEVLKKLDYTSKSRL
jgi:hypothetical protein